MIKSLEKSPTEQPNLMPQNIPHILYLQSQWDLVPGDLLGIKQELLQNINPCASTCRRPKSMSPEECEHLKVV